MSDDLHWLAGLLEGEGSFLPGPPSAPRSPVLQFTMTDRDVVERAAVLLGASVNVIRPRQSHWRTAYGVRVTGTRAVAWMKELRPLMGERRRSQIERAVASYAPNPNRRLDNAQAREALLLLAQGESVATVAQRFGTSIWCIYDLRLGRTYRDLSRAL